MSKANDLRLTSSISLLLANVLEAALPLIRNITLARLVTPEQFGLAVSLAVVITTVEAFAEFGLPMFAIRGKAPIPIAEAIATLHSLALIRALTVSVFIAAVSPFLSIAFHAPDSTWAYALLGLVSLLRGLENLGVKEAMRRHIYWREAAALVTAQITSAIVTIVFAAIFRSFDCMIWGMIAGNLVLFVLSNVLSPYPYRLRWNRTVVSSATDFGRPLIAHGIAVAAGGMDRVLVGTALGLSPLALYNVSVGTAILPRWVITKFFLSIFVPLFTQAKEEQKDLKTLSNTWIFILSCVAASYGLALGSIGDLVIGFVFGDIYRPSKFFMCLVGLNLTVKFFMLLPVPLAYASGDTRRVALGSILSALAIAPGALILFLVRSLDMFLLVMTLVEFVAMIWFTSKVIEARFFSDFSTWATILLPFFVLTLISSVAFILPLLRLTDWLLICGFSFVTLALSYLIVARYMGLSIRGDPQAAGPPS